MDDSLSKLHAHMHVGQRQLDEFRFSIIVRALRPACLALVVAFALKAVYSWRTQADLVGDLAVICVAGLVLASSWTEWFRSRWPLIMALTTVGYAAFAFFWPAWNHPSPDSLSGPWATLLYWTSTIEALLIIAFGLILPQLGPRAVIPAGLAVIALQLSSLRMMGLPLGIVGGWNPFYALAVLVPLAAASYSLEAAHRLEYIYRRLHKREKQNSENLLVNLLPRSAINSLKQDTYPIAEIHQTVGVMFADLVGFTEFTKSRSAQDIVRLLDRIFSDFDRVAKQYSIEKIKTIGDCYMGCTGVGNSLATQPKQLARAAMGMQEALSSLNRELNFDLRLRVGLHVGPAVAGVIGRKKPSYDLWGSTVNMASRMESTGEPGRIQVSDEAKHGLDPWFNFEGPRLVTAKGLGEIRTWWLHSAKEFTGSVPLPPADFDF